MYREGYEYVVCDECNSHILLIDIEQWGPDWEDHGIDETVMDFTCDWEPCLADFLATVFKPTPQEHHDRQQ